MCASGKDTLSIMRGESFRNLSHTKLGLGFISVSASVYTSSPCTLITLKI